jgi:hypothetical protein
MTTDGNTTVKILFVLESTFIVTEHGPALIVTRGYDDHRAFRGFVENAKSYYRCQFECTPAYPQILTMGALFSYNSSAGPANRADRFLSYSSGRARLEAMSGRSLRLGTSAQERRVSGA